MKAILTGSIVFVIWSSISTYYYVCNIEGLCFDDQPQTSMTIVSVPEEPKEVAVISDSDPLTEPEPEISSPGFFTVHYQYNHQEYIIDEDFDNYIRQVQSFVEQSPDSKVRITGYTDSIGPEEFNYQLGLHRANYVKEVLMKNGVSKNNIVVLSKGESSPLEANNTKPGRAKNRRSEIEIE